ncbi:IS3-Spn1 transposase [Streptococcus pneumoniae]|nr:IS3-Spn1 transposase [Streptococcus pneumoniae]
MTEFSLDILLKAIKLARSTYYYHLKQLDKTDKDQELKAEIQSIPNFKLKLATQKKFTWRLVVQAFFRVVVNPIFDKSYFFRSRFLGSFR